VVAVVSTVLFYALWRGRAPAASDVVSFAVYPPEKAAFSAALNTTVKRAGVRPFSRRAHPRVCRLHRRRRTVAVAPAHRGCDGPPVSRNRERPRSVLVARQPLGGFYTDGKVKKIPAYGGPVQVVEETHADFRGGTWGPDDTILFASGTLPEASG
jgi:hypothetical protein